MACPGCYLPRSARMMPLNCLSLHHSFPATGGTASGHSGANHGPQFVPLDAVNYGVKLFSPQFFFI